MADDRTVQTGPRDEVVHHSALSPGTRLGRYDIASVLGQGSFGITYRGRDLQLDREVAIKEYLPALLAMRADGVTVLPRSTQLAEDFAWGRVRFLDEAKTIARLAHAPAVVRVYDFLEANGTAYVVMELVEGETLAMRYKREPRLSQNAIETILHPLLDSLEMVHAAGFLHRDIKPENIIIMADGRPKLIDFGAARAAISDRTVTMTAMFTPAYAAPEQFESGKLGPWTDIYGLAATLYSGIAGTPPASAVKRVMDPGVMPSASEVGEGRYTRGLLAGIDAALAVRSRDRPQSIAAWRTCFADQGPPLRALQEPVQAAAPVQATRPAKRFDPRTAILVSGVAVFIVVAAVLGYWFLGPSPPLEVRLDAVLARGLPKKAENAREEVFSFARATPNRALALAPRAGMLHHTGRWQSADVAAEKVLEQCQQIHDEPCALVAVDDEIFPAAAGGTWPVRDAPRVRYAGAFKLERIPAMRPAILERPEIVGYTASASPKAVAFNAAGVLAAVSGGASQRAAEEKALEVCSQEALRQKADGPCYLYAVEDRVVLPLRATEPITAAESAAVNPASVAPRQSPPSPPPASAAPIPAPRSVLPPVAPKLHTLLVGEMQRLVPLEDAQVRESEAAGYVASIAHKAFAVSPSYGAWRSAGWGSAVLAEERTLEGCQIRYGSPCVLVAVDDVTLVGGSSASRSMPRAEYDGLFDPSRIPAVETRLRERTDVAGYRAVQGAKAAAFHPSGRLSIVAAAASQRDAEERALAQCNDEISSKREEGPCFLYAVANQVVLPRRATDPVTPAGAAGAAVPASVEATLRAKLLESLAKVTPSATVAAREAQATLYEGAPQHKALAAHPPTGSWRASGWESPALAEERALEGCQLRYGGPCILVAGDNTLQQADPGAARRAAGHVDYSGPFDPSRIPTIREVVRQRSDVVGYLAIAGPKAAALDPSGRLFIVTQATSQRDAEERALSACNRDPDRGNEDGPCFLYAAGNLVVLLRRATDPITPASTEAAAAPAPVEATLRARLLDGLAKVVQTDSVTLRESQAAQYQSSPWHKALAGTSGGGSWRSVGWENPAVAEVRALEGCQVRYGKPCVLIAVNETVQPSATGGTLQSMPRAYYAGLFDPEQIPAGQRERQRSDVLGYRAAQGAKAAAIHPWGRVFVVTGAASQRDAEERALSACNRDPDRENKDGPCFLYAAGNQVVLPRRATDPVTPAGVATGTSPAPAETTLRARLLDGLAKVVPTDPVTRRESQAAQYQSAAWHKALAGIAGSGSWKTWNWESPVVAEERTLEGCQVRYGRPCVLIAVNETVQPPDPGAIPQSMPRVEYAGLFDPQQIPATGNARQRPDVLGYRAASGFKAAAFHPWGRLFVVTGATSQRDAEERALAQCNGDPQRNDQDGPCLLYAAGDAVVLPKRATTPIAR